MIHRGGLQPRHSQRACALQTADSCPLNTAPCVSKCIACRSTL
uniref:Uncharacterized protein n=1 Tax=Anguilla anguilla TaxID=7936 RepID=A0A0E9U1E7_ANGAN